MTGVKINSSYMHILTAKLRQRLGFTSTNQVHLEIIETGENEKYPYIKLNNNQIFFHRFSESPLREIFTRHVFSHYEIDRKPNPTYGTDRNHVDNLLNLKVDNKIKKFLLENMPIKQGDIVLELGAYCGFGTMKLSQLVGENGKVIAVEADKINFEILKKNIHSNNIKNVIPINKGIWNKKGTLTLFKELNQRNSLVEGLLENIESKDEIEVDTVDNILSELKMDRIDFITMEINAAEINGLKGMQKTLSKNNIRLVSAGWYDFEGKPAWITIKEILSKQGFSVYIGVQNRVFAIKK